MNGHFRRNECLSGSLTEFFKQSANALGIGDDSYMPISIQRLAEARESFKADLGRAYAWISLGAFVAVVVALVAERFDLPFVFIMLLVLPLAFLCLGLLSRRERSGFLWARLLGAATGWTSSLLFFLLVPVFPATVFAFVRTGFFLPFVCAILVWAFMRIANLVWYNRELRASSRT